MIARPKETSEERAGETRRLDSTDARTDSRLERDGSVLRHLKYIYPLFDARDRFYEDSGKMLLLALVFKVVQFACFSRSCRGAAIGPPSKAKP